MVSLQLVDVGLVRYDDVLKLLQLGHLVLQGPSDLKGAAADFLQGHATMPPSLSDLHLLRLNVNYVSVGYASTPDLHSGLYPGSNEISLSSKLTSQPFMSVLACHLLLEGAVSLRN